MCRTLQPADDDVPLLEPVDEDEPPRRRRRSAERSTGMSTNAQLIIGGVIGVLILGAGIGIAVLVGGNKDKKKPPTFNPNPQPGPWQPQQPQPNPWEQPPPQGPGPHFPAPPGGPPPGVPPGAHEPQQEEASARRLAPRARTVEMPKTQFQPWPAGSVSDRSTGLRSLTLPARQGPKPPGTIMEGTAAFG